jgi:16S rRNA (uracil1498-N3)-methyltransferase
MERFFCSDLSHDLAVLDGEESHHLIRVHRKRLGDFVHLMDGKGKFAKGIIQEFRKSEVIIQLHEITSVPPNPKSLTLAVSPLKSEDRWEWLLEKATEIGVSSFLPILCERSESKRFRLERYEKIVLGAAKQSLKAFIPKIHSPIPLNTAVGQMFHGFYFGHCLDTFSKTEVKSISILFPSTIFIGPEGDFTPAEILFMNKANGIPISLGSERLRTETAAIAAATLSLL